MVGCLVLLAYFINKGACQKANNALIRKLAQIRTLAGSSAQVHTDGQGHLELH